MEKTKEDKETVKTVNESIQESDWIKQELDDVEENKFNGEVVQPLKFEEGKITKFVIKSVEKPFDKWIEKETGLVKKIIPVEHEGENKKLWLNTRNPLYGELLKRLHKGQTEFKVIQTGTKDKTRYSLVED